MLNFLSTISIFGYELDWDASTAMFWLLVIQGVLILIEIAVFCTLILRSNRKNKNNDEQAQQPVQNVAQQAEPRVVVIQQPKAEEVKRELTGLTLDLGVVQREFTVGDEFNCEGLVIHAEYNTAPTTETVSYYTVVDEEPDASAQGCYVIKPDLSQAGKVTVGVRFNTVSTLYTISVEEPAPAVEEQPVETVVPAVEEEPERELVGISIDVRVVKREFVVGETFNCEGLVITANFNADPTTESIVEYSVVDEELFGRIANANEIAGCYVVTPDLSEAGIKTVTVKYENMTAYYTIAVTEPEQEEEPERTLLYITLNTDGVQKEFYAGDALNHDGLIVTAVFNTEPTEVVVDDYSVLAPDMSKEGNPTVTVVYQDRSVGYRITVNALPEEERKKREPIIIEEESAEAGTLRYDKSFQARLIQSDDDVKRWYTDLKNELLSYKKVHDRYSWKRETYKSGKVVVAKIAFRGKTMCLFLPLDPAEFAETKYQLEDVSNTPSNVETPSMYRIKNEKRIKYAIELIGIAMEKLGLPRVEHISEDFYMPYEGIVELIKKGLIKRNIKTAEEEAIFNQGKEEAAATEAQPEEPQEIAPGIFVTPKTEE